MLVAYVNGADARALAGVRTVDVLVADAVIPEGTPAADLPALVRTVQVPAKTAVGGRVDDLASLSGRVADVDVQPGEQLLAARFVRPDERQAPGTVAVPADAVCVDSSAVALTGAPWIWVTRTKCRTAWVCFGSA